MRISKSELLVAVSQRLADPKNWTQGRRMRETLDSDRGWRQSWCLTGAIIEDLHQRGFQPDHLTDQLYQELAATFAEQHPELTTFSLGRRAVQRYNDNTSHRELLAVLEKVHTKLIERGE